MRERPALPTNLPPPSCQPRRAFLTRLGVIAGAAALSPGLVGCETVEMHSDPPKKGATLSFDTSAAPFTALGAVGGFVAADVEGMELVLVRISTAKVIALSRACPHASLDMAAAPASKFDVAKGVWICGWHVSEFKADGTAIAGPAAPGGKLDSFSVVFDAASGKGTVTT